MRGVSTNILDQKINTAWTIALKNIPDTRGLEPYRPRILVSCAQLFRDFSKFTTTAVQSSPPAVRTCPKYLKEVTVSSGCP